MFNLFMLAADATTSEGNGGSQQWIILVVLAVVLVGTMLMSIIPQRKRQKKAQEMKARQKVVQVKEVKFRPATDENDYQTKLRALRRFLADGDKAKVTLRYRGREMAHQDLGAQIMHRIRDELAEEAQIEQHPKLEGRQMIMVLAPKKKK